MGKPKLKGQIWPYGPWVDRWSLAVLRRRLASYVLLLHPHPFFRHLQPASRAGYTEAMAPPRSDSIQDGGALLSVPFDPAFDGDLPSFKFLVLLLDRGSGRLREAVEALRVEDEGLMKGLSALHVAAGRGNLDMCRYLVEDLGVDVNVVDGEGRTPLFWTVLSKNVGAAKYLLDHGANQDKANHDGFSPLHQAVESGGAEMVELLLAKGAYFDPVTTCGTPLHFAATQWQDRTMKILLEHNSDWTRMGVFPGEGS
uniref:Uncharacterized protein n=1 Tax=Avena sativa TaxID=4498 RepID=A0ACD5T722_AVESA